MMLMKSLSADDGTTMATMMHGDGDDTEGGRCCSSSSFDIFSSDE